jgi:hypothetical protein
MPRWYALGTISNYVYVLNICSVIKFSKKYACLQQCGYLCKSVYLSTICEQKGSPHLTHCIYHIWKLCVPSL